MGLFSWFSDSVAKAKLDQELLRATEIGDQQQTEALIMKGARVNTTIGNAGVTPLYVAAENGHRDVAVLLLEKGAEVNHTNREGETPLHVAVKNDHRDIVALLLEKGAEVNRANTNGVTPLHVAVWHGHREVVISLLYKGADITATTNDGERPADLAVRKNRVSLLPFLVR